MLGLRGDLGSGKTTWVRAMLRGLGYSGPRAVADLYACSSSTPATGSRSSTSISIGCGGEDELENLGLRDWLAEPVCWIAVEWPERAPQLAARCDLTLEFAVTASGGRRVTSLTQAPALESRR